MSLNCKNCGGPPDPEKDGCPWCGDGCKRPTSSPELARQQLTGALLRCGTIDPRTLLSQQQAQQQQARMMMNQRPLSIYLPDLNDSTPTALEESYRQLRARKNASQPYSRLVASQYAPVAKSPTPFNFWHELVGVVQVALLIACSLGLPVLFIYVLSSLIRWASFLG